MCPRVNSHLQEGDALPLVSELTEPSFHASDAYVVAVTATRAMATTLEVLV